MLKVGLGEFGVTEPALQNRRDKADVIEPKVRIRIWSDAASH